MKALHFIAIALVLIAVSAAMGAPVFSDGFESYVGGGQPLDKNYASGPNAAANGSGNPWFGPAPPNARVVGAEDTVTPHSGNQMIRGSAPSDLDENWVNLAYRCNGGAAFTGNIQMDWWFYDKLGSGGTAMKDYAALGFYNTAPGTTDYPGTGSLNSSTQIQRLALGATSNQAAGFNSQVYQARVVGATDGYASGWFNVNTPRTVGWHHGRIVVGPALVDNTNDVSFFIDDLANPTFTHNSMTTWGINVIELNTNYGATSGYYDDVSLSIVPEPLSLLASLLVLPFLYRRRAA
jgi:hypothetical protein